MTQEQANRVELAREVKAALRAAGIGCRTCTGKSVFAQLQPVLVQVYRAHLETAQRLVAHKFAGAPVDVRQDVDEGI